LDKLDVLLEAAVARARVAFATEENGYTFRGLYISEDELDWVMQRKNGETLGSDPNLAKALDAFFGAARAGAVGAQWGFSDFEEAVLVIALAPEIDLRYERIYAYLQDDVTKRRPSVDLALSLLCRSPQGRLEQRSRFLPEGSLIRSGMLRLLADQSLIEAPLLALYLRLDERAIGAFLGNSELDSRLAAFCEWAGSPATPADSLEQSDIVRRLAAFSTAFRNSGRPVRLSLSGPPTLAKRQAAEALGAREGSPLLAADLSHCVTWRSDPLTVASLLAREATLSGAMLVIAGITTAATDLDPARALLAALARHPGAIVIASDNPSLPAIAADYLDVPFALPDQETRRNLWERLTTEAGIALGPTALTSLANNFRLAPDQIAAAVETARQRLAWETTAPEGLGPEAATKELQTAARGQSGGELSALTNKVEPIYRWTDIVLPNDSIQQLKEICARVTFGDTVMERGGFARKMSSGKGITVLFAGPSGTGKSMAAEVIANELGLGLYRIDLSRVVSKYIGETEQNLERIFNAAVRSNSVLLFNEADSLMGKRSPVHDAHDRYANIEISYLLQKMEQYEGITILTTNLRGNIDDAFLRRLTFTIHFPFPEEESRLEIWKRIWPAETTLASDIDFAMLAKHFRLSGGNISNIGLSAAFLAAAAGRPVNLEDILRATRREYSKVGKDIGLTELRSMVGYAC
jgi:SpoVK/Ycf46/Vps4 family AAA+-type ATPase